MTLSLGWNLWRTSPLVMTGLYFAKLLIVSFCIVSIHLYRASCSAHQSEARPLRETQREESGAQTQNIIRYTCRSMANHTNLLCSSWINQLYSNKSTCR